MDKYDRYASVGKYGITLGWRAAKMGKARIDRQTILALTCHLFGLNYPMCIGYDIYRCERFTKFWSKRKNGSLQFCEYTK
ncbi:hypothetical protein POVWA2_014860 [Plasmodium ovale wallikeri]|uniref:Uncharacterized protein n=1 Tax=Plasmodium ovale wallikeri TaxID=864142 RepID=A0A1A8YN81_PLAOA|nr:hypothetical protein POVWA1_015210 [Plasmodium ovale wallikeri]SBT33451.1 hypothetical protein POVWA2_014860 [Plasmodium ovale wallikeri]